MEEHVTFKSGEIRLRGTLYKPDGPGPFGAIVVLHSASGGTRHDPFYEHLKEALPARGSAVFVYDRRGSGESEGEFATADFEALAADGAAAFNTLRRRPDIDPERIGLYGISQGGWIAPILAAKEPAVALMIIVSGCAVPPAGQMDYGARYTLNEAGFPEEIQDQAIALRHRVNDYFRGDLDRETLQAELREAKDRPWFGHAYISRAEALPEDVTQEKWYYEMDYDPLPVWGKLALPTLFLHGDRDRWVPVPESRARYQEVTAHMSEVKFVTLSGVDHLMRYADGPAEGELSAEYLEILLDWLGDRGQ
jgi:dipeptidyl aminopeptidase/acylaminoacyl peptidase